MSKTPSSMDTRLESDTPTTPSSHHLQIPSTDITENSPTRKSPSVYSRSTVSSLAKYKVYLLSLNLFLIHYSISENIGINIRN